MTPTVQFKAARPDGWPLCPSCGNDEVYSLLFWNGAGERPPLKDYVLAGLKCYVCAWSLEPSTTIEFASCTCGAGREPGPHHDSRCPFKVWID